MITDPKKWMSLLPDGLSCAAVSLPGTHNSSTKHIPLGLICRCQNTTVTEQLNFGVRMLDIRLELCTKGFKTVHSIIDCRESPLGGRLYFDTIFTQMRSFLTENPSETVFMLLSEDDRKDETRPFWDTFYKMFIAPHKDIWFLENRLPLLSECRGRIVLMRRVGLGDSCPDYGDYNTGLNLTAWGNMGDKKTHSPERLDVLSVTSGEHLYSVVVQDRYMHAPSSKWHDVMLPTLDGASAFDGTLRLNYTSTAGGFLMPVFNARYINRHLAKYRFVNGRYYGWYLLDFVSPALCDKIIALNY